MRRSIQRWMLMSCYRRGSRRVTATEPTHGWPVCDYTSGTGVFPPHPSLLDKGQWRRQGREPSPCAHSALVSRWILLRTPKLPHLLGWSLSVTSLYQLGGQGFILPPATRPVAFCAPCVMTPKIPILAQPSILGSRLRDSAPISTRMFDGHGKHTTSKATS